MQFINNQNKQATMSSNTNNNSNYPNFYQMQGKVLNNFVNEQHSVQLGFFLDDKAFNTNRNDDVTLLPYNPTGRDTSNNADILTQDSDNEQYIELTDMPSSQEQIISPGNGNTLSNTNDNIAKTSTLSTDNTKTLPKPNNKTGVETITFSHNINVGQDSNTVETHNGDNMNNTLPNAYAPALKPSSKIDLSTAKVTPVTDRKTDDKINSLLEASFNKTLPPARRTPINDPNAVFGSYGRLYNGFMTANALMAAELNGKNNGNGVATPHNETNQIPAKILFNKEQTTPQALFHTNNEAETNLTFKDKALNIKNPYKNNNGNRTPI